MHFNRIILSLIILFISLNLKVKGQWIVGLGTTHGFNISELYIWEYKVEKTMSHGIYAKVGYEFRLFSNLGLGITPGFQQHYDEIGINNINVETFSYHFDIPVDISFYYKNNWRIMAGVSMQNYRVLDEFAIERSYNARLNLNAGLMYLFHKNWGVEVAFSTILSDKQNAFLIRNYPNHFSIGMQYRFHLRRKELND